MARVRSLVFLRQKSCSQEASLAFEPLKEMDRKPRIKLPSSTKDILELFSLSRTNQILRGRSPIFEEQNEENKGWTELVASEILSAQVEVVPQPQEFNVNLAATDPRRGRYQVSSNLDTRYLIFVSLCLLYRWFPHKGTFVNILEKGSSMAYCKNIIWWIPRWTLGVKGKKSAKKIWMIGNTKEPKAWKGGRKRRARKKSSARKRRKSIKSIR